MANERGIYNIDPVAEDVQQLTIEENCIDGALARWLLAYIPDPQAVVSKIARALKPGGTFCVIDYFNHDAVMVGPRSDLCDKVFRSIHKSVRDSGGDPDIGDRIPQYMHNAGLEIVEIRPISGIGRPGTQLWNFGLYYNVSGKISSESSGFRSFIFGGSCRLHQDVVRV